MDDFKKFQKTQKEIKKDSFIKSHTEKSSENFRNQLASRIEHLKKDLEEMQKTLEALNR